MPTATRIRPPCSCTIAYATVSPSPVPFPTSFVVKNGSKILLFISAGNPGPVVGDFEHDGVALDIVPRADDERARPLADEHRLFGVDDEIEEHLLDLVRVGEDVEAVRTASAVDDRDVREPLLVRRAAPASRARPG